MYVDGDTETTLVSRGYSVIPESGSATRLHPVRSHASWGGTGSREYIE